MGDSAEFVVQTASVGFLEEEEKPVMLSQSLVEEISLPTTETVIEVSDQESVNDEGPCIVETIIEVDIPLGPNLSDAERRSSEEALKYIAGFIAHKKKKDHPELVGDGILQQPAHCPWIDAVSYGGLTKPSQAWLDQVLEFERVFQKLHGSDISRQPMLISKFAEELAKTFPQTSPTLLMYYAKTRVHIRLKFLKNKFKKSSLENRNKRKVKHFTC